MLEVLTMQLFSLILINLLGQLSEKKFNLSRALENF